MTVRTLTHGFMLLAVAAAAALADAPTTSTKGERPSAQTVAAFAEDFLLKCSKKDEAGLKGMMSFPFLVLAPCKGGDFESMERFMDEVLKRDAGSPPPKGLKRKIVSLEQYVAALRSPSPPEKGKEADDAATKAFEADLKRRFAGDVRVVCLYLEHKNGPSGLVVFVRADRGGMRAIAVSLGLPIPIEPERKPRD